MRQQKLKLRHDQKQTIDRFGFSLKEDHVFISLCKYMLISFTNVTIERIIQQPNRIDNFKISHYITLSVYLKLKNHEFDTGINCVCLTQQVDVCVIFYPAGNLFYRHFCSISFIPDSNLYAATCYKNGIFSRRMYSKITYIFRDFFELKPQQFFEFFLIHNIE